MGLKINSLPQVSTAQKPETKTVANTTKTSFDTKNGNQSITDKKASLNLAGEHNKLKLQNALVNKPQQVQDENKQINGVTTKTVLPKSIGEGETQESVLRRTYDEMAFKAGISNKKLEGQEKSPAEMFIENRMEANKEANKGEYRIFHRNSDSAFDETEWKAQSKSGLITMHVSENDIEQLKTFKGESDRNDGIRTADEVIKGMESGDYRALDKVRMQQGNADFQEGFVNRLGAEKFLKLENNLSDNPSYSNVMRDSLSTVSQNEINYDKSVEREPSVSEQIGKKASVEQLARLTNSEFYAMGKGFLVEAGKKVAEKGIGWSSQDRGLVTQNSVNPNTSKVLEAVSKNKEASLELLQDEKFVKNAFTASEAGVADDNKTAKAFGDILRNGTSADLPKAQREQALMNVANVLKNPDEISRLNVMGGNPVSTTVRKETAQALTDVFANNTELFVNASDRPSDMSKLDKTDVAVMFKTIQEFPELREKASQTVANEYVRLVNNAISNNNEHDAQKAARLQRIFIGVENETKLNDAKQNDENFETFGKGVGVISELTNFYGLRNKVGEKVADGVGKLFDKASEVTIKGSRADQVAKDNSEVIDKLHQFNAIYTVAAFENDAYKKKDTNEEARNFLKDLKTINDALPEGEKILKPNGRLIDIQSATGRQKANLQDLTNNSTGIIENNLEEVKKATDRLSKRMTIIKNALTLSTVKEGSK